MPELNLTSLDFLHSHGKELNDLPMGRTWVKSTVVIANNSKSTALMDVLAAATLDSSPYSAKDWAESLLDILHPVGGVWTAGGEMEELVGRCQTLGKSNMLLEDNLSALVGRCHALNSIEVAMHFLNMVSFI